MDSEIQLSLESLKRLGLIKIDKFKSTYDSLRKCNVIIEIKEGNEFVPYQCFITPTYFGAEFAEVCCEEAGTEDSLISGNPIKELIIGNDSIEIV